MMRVAELLIATIEQNYREDVSLVHLHGSYAYGDPHDRSDLDLYLVPRTARGYALGCTFILDGVGCDLWALGWERLARIAEHEERISSILTEGEVLWAASEQELARFERLAEHAREVGRQPLAERAVRATRALEPAYRTWFHLTTAQSVALARTRAIELLGTLSYALAELNGTPVRRGRAMLKDELLAMPLVPGDLAAQWDAVLAGRERAGILAASGQLLASTAGLVARHEPRSPRVTLAAAATGWYEEAIQSYNKTAHACETGDAVTALFALAELSWELADLLAQVVDPPQVPDVVALYDPDDLPGTAARVRGHQSELEATLERGRVPVRRFGTLEEVRGFLETL